MLDNKFEFFPHLLGHCVQSGIASEHSKILSVLLSLNALPLNHAILTEECSAFGCVSFAIEYSLNFFLLNCGLPVLEWLGFFLSVQCKEIFEEKQVFGEFLGICRKVQDRVEVPSNLRAHFYVWLFV